jgi:hypothetical protein
MDPWLGENLTEAAMLNRTLFALLVGCGAWLAAPSAADACGGFFCGRLPVDQTAERIVFKVGSDSTTMITQIAYTGSAPDFAWVLPLASVPDVKSLGVFPQRALTALDANTGPQFQLPDQCLNFGPLASRGGAGQSDDAGSSAEDESGVTVHYRAEVGPYEVAAIESADPMALFEWLRTNMFNVNDMMLPYIRKYTEEGMKFIALKLKKDKDTRDIQPFRFDLPGTSPSIPLRMTAVAAEPEMSIVVFVLADQRYNGANWPEIEIEDDQIVWRASRFPIVTNWSALVARGVDEAGGQGWVTELAGSTSQLRQALENSSFATPEDEEAGAKLLEVIGDAPYVSRLYARMSAEEMTSDPVFRRDAGGDVSNVRKLARNVNGVDQCSAVPPPVDPCLFTSCGAGGICRPVMLPGSSEAVAGCGCLPGATARTTFDPAAVSLQATGAATMTAAVVCQDQRMSFVNPGDVAVTGEKMMDPCLNFDCGELGECRSVNMTPTCVCDQGSVAVGSMDSAGVRSTRCAKPMIAVPPRFYAQRLPDLPEDLPGGRTVKLEPSEAQMPVVQPRMSDLGSGSGALPDAAPGPASSDSSDDCHVRAPGARTGSGAALLLLLAAAGLGWRRRRG